METTNTTYTFSHPNFNSAASSASLNKVATDDAGLSLDVIGANGKVGAATLYFQDNGDAVLRVHLTASSPLRVLVLDESGVILER